jgi:hypothetical protein
MFFILYYFWVANIFHLCSVTLYKTLQNLEEKDFRMFFILYYFWVANIFHFCSVRLYKTIFCKILIELFLYESHFACMLLHEHLLKGQCQENFWTLFFTNQLLSDTIYLTATRCLCNPAFIFKVDCMHKELVDTWKSEVTNLVTLSV